MAKPHETRVEKLMGAPLARDAMRHWPQSGEVVRGRDRIAEVESHFEGFKIAIARRRQYDDGLIVVEWSGDYGDGRVYRNVSLGELRDGEVISITDYWGEPFVQPAWRAQLSECERVSPTPDQLAPA